MQQNITEIISTQNDTLNKLNKILFEALDRINDDNLSEEKINIEVMRLQAICGTADRVVNAVCEQNNNLKIVGSAYDAMVDAGVFITSKTIKLSD